MKRKLLVVITSLVMAVTGMTGAMTFNTDFAAAAAEDPYDMTELEGAVETVQNDYMTSSQYKKLFGVDLSTKKVDEFDPDDTSNPLEGFEPNVLSELFLGYMNKSDAYDGYFSVMENVADDASFNMDSMWNTSYGGANKYYGQDENEDMYTHAINTIALTPGDLTEEDARYRKQILIESRIYLEEDGFLQEDDTHQMISTYTYGDDNKWRREKYADIWLSDDHWAWDIRTAEQQSYTAMAVGDYDGDNYNEVAIYRPYDHKHDKCAMIGIYQPYPKGNTTYQLVEEKVYYLNELGNRFNAQYDNRFAFVHLNTTNIAGHDDLVVSVSLPYHGDSDFTDNGALAVLSFQDGTVKTEFNFDMNYDDYRFKFHSTVNADLDGDGTEELVVGGFKNTGYSINGDKKGSISNDEYLVNVLLYENGAYKLAWSKPQVTKGITLNHDIMADAPAAMAAGKFREGALTDTVFLEGTYLDFMMGNGSTVNEKIRNGMFGQDTSENMNGSSYMSINMGACGSFVSDKQSAEQVVFYTPIENQSDDDYVDVDIVWSHFGENSKIATDVVNDNYMSGKAEDKGTIITMCPVNVDQDTSFIKYTGKTVGWSNPVVYGILMSMPYWKELDYGNAWNARGQTDLGITETKGDGTSISTGVDLGYTLNLGTSTKFFGNGFETGFDIGAMAGYAYEKTNTEEISKGITWSVGGGEDYVAMLVMPVVMYQYEIIVPEHKATKMEEANGKSGTIAEERGPVTCTKTMEPVYTDVSVEAYNDVIEEFNAMAEAEGNAEDKLPLIDMEEVYAGSNTGDPSTYAPEPLMISSLEGTENVDYYHKDGAYSQTGKDKAVETLTIEATSSESETNGFTAGLKSSVAVKASGGVDVGVVEVEGSLGHTFDVSLNAGASWVSTESTGVTYSGSFANIPDDAATYNYEYSAGLVKWNANLEGFDNQVEIDGTDEFLPDKTVVIGPVVTISDTKIPPALPEDLHVLGVTSSEAVLQWTNPEGDRAPDYYKVYYSKEGEGYHALDGTIDGKATSFRIKGLLPDTGYYFRLESYKHDPSDEDPDRKSMQSAPVHTVTKKGGEPKITTHPQDCYAKVGEKALFNIEAEPYVAGNTISYQWQKLAILDYGISWNDINVASDGTIGRTAEFNAAYASAGGVVNQQDVDDLNGNIYRCVVTEHQKGILDYVDTISNSATLHAGNGVMAAPVSLDIEAVRGIQTSDSQILVAAGEDLKVTASLKDQADKPIEGTEVYFALMDKSQDGKCIAYLSGKTDQDGKAEITFEELKAGSYEITAIVKKQGDEYRAAASNSIQVAVNESYDIVYELNGGINHNLNPVCYALGTKLIVLRDASREGYEFTGWYLDKELQHRVEKKWLDVSEMSGTITLYAGWKAIEEEQPPVTPDDPQKPDEPVTPDDPQFPDGPSDGNDDPAVNPDTDKPDDVDKSTAEQEKQDDGNKAEQNDKKDHTNTQTGDDFNAIMAFVAMFVPLIACLGAVFMRKKKI